jgi:hypothetical protein
MQGKKVISKTRLTNMSKSGKSAYTFQQKSEIQHEILRFLISILNF